MTEDRRPIPVRGVVEYVAELQQLEEPLPAAARSAPPAWPVPSVAPISPVPLTASVAPGPPVSMAAPVSPSPVTDGGQRVAARKAPQPLCAPGLSFFAPVLPSVRETPPDPPVSGPPVPEPAPAVAPPVVETLILDLSEPAPSRDRKRLITVAALIVLLVAGVAGYLVTRGPDPGKPRPPAAEAPLAPAPSAPPAAAPGRRPSPDLARPAAVGSPGHPVIVASRPASHTPAPGTPTAGASLTATYRYVVGGVTDVLTGYVGTVRITNKGVSPAIGWTVRLTVPLANAVTVETGDVTVTREGSTVVFTPLPPVAPIVAGDTKGFSFELSGPLAAVPTGCTVDSTPCT